MVYFLDRSDAGQQLASMLQHYRQHKITVYALPRGGVPVAAEIAKSLCASLGLVFAHKIGHPYQPEYAIAAISENGHLIKTSREIEEIDEAWWKREVEREKAEITRKRKFYLKGAARYHASDEIAILVDDGIATGLTMQAGIVDLKDRHPKKIVVAVPVVPKSIFHLLQVMVDEVVAVLIPEDHLFLGAVGAYYKEFYQTEDREVIALLDEFN